MTLCIQADVERFLQIDVSAEPEPQVTYLIENAGAQIESYLDRKIEQANFTDVIDGDLGSMIRLKQWPVTLPLTTVVEDGITLTEDVDYVAHGDGRVYRGTDRHSLGWARGRKIITVTYEAGYLVVPFEIRDVCARMVARAFQAGAAYANAPAGAESIKSLSLEGSDSIEYTDAVRDVAVAAMPMLPEEMMMVGRYKRVVFA
jgi:hypothetical protein